VVLLYSAIFGDISDIHLVAFPLTLSYGFPSYLCIALSYHKYFASLVMFLFVRFTNTHCHV